MRFPLPVGGTIPWGSDRGKGPVRRAPKPKGLLDPAPAVREIVQETGRGGDP